VYIYIYELFLYIDMTSNQSSQSGSAEQLAVWHSAIYSALGTRKNGATEAEIQKHYSGCNRRHRMQWTHNPAQLERLLQPFLRL
jgi:hypothetical protein